MKFLGKKNSVRVGVILAVLSAAVDGVYSMEANGSSNAWKNLAEHKPMNLTPETWLRLEILNQKIRSLPESKESMLSYFHMDGSLWNSDFEKLLNAFKHLESNTNTYYNKLLPSIRDVLFSVSGHPGAAEIFISDSKELAKSYRKASKEEREDIYYEVAGNFENLLNMSEDLKEKARSNLDLLESYRIKNDEGGEMLSEAEENFVISNVDKEIVDIENRISNLRSLISSAESQEKTFKILAGTSPAYSIAIPFVGAPISLGVGIASLVEMGKIIDKIHEIQDDINKKEDRVKHLIKLRYGIKHATITTRDINRWIERSRVSLIHLIKHFDDMQISLYSAVAVLDSVDEEKKKAMMRSMRTVLSGYEKQIKEAAYESTRIRSSLRNVVVDFDFFEGVDRDSVMNEAKRIIARSARTYYLIKTRMPDNRCLETIGNHAPHDGSNVQIWDCHGGGNQRFSMDDLGRLRSFGDPTKCIVKYGKNLVAGSCDESLDQRWFRHVETFKQSDGRIEDIAYSFRPVLDPVDISDKEQCFDAVNGSNDANVYQHDCHHGMNQQWTFTDPAVFTILSNGSNSKYCMDVSGGNSSERGVMQVLECTGYLSSFERNQRFRMDGDGRIKTMLDESMCLVVKKQGGSMQVGDKLGLERCDLNRVEQEWHYTEYSQLVPNIMESSSRPLCLDVEDEIYDGAGIVLKECSSSSTQTWNKY